MAVTVDEAAAEASRQVLPYRTAFETDLEFRETVDRVREQLRSWLQTKGYDVEKFDDGDPGLARGVVIRHAATNDVYSWQLRERQAESITWVSTVSVTRGRHQARTWIGLNVEAIGSGGVLPPPAAPPKLARLLLASVDAYDGEAQLRDGAVAVNAAGVDDLLEIVCAEYRRLPVVVAAAPADVPFEDWKVVVNRLVRLTPGLASSYLLDPRAVTQFNEGIGVTYGIGPGSVRTYLPDVDPAIADDAVRHRVLSRRRIDDEPARAARVLAVLPRQLASATVPSTVARGLTLSVREFHTAKPTSDDLVAGLRDEIRLLTDLLAVADDNERGLSGQVSLQLDEILGLTADLENAREDLERRDATVRALRQRLIEKELFEQAYLPIDEPEPLPTSFSDLFDRIDRLRPHVLFTGDQSLALDLDEQLQNRAWAQAAWQGLLALFDYARACKDKNFEGDFKTWCENPPDGDLHAISAGKVARDESLAVRNNRKFMKARMFAVPESVDAARRIFMGAHIRLGNSTTVAPRMYFHDAVRVSDAIYVGYIGPHLPNTLTSST